ncbi:hypothetical protein SESBI_00905 [Sesbania bispinosa]|nr:hypothetical protein SESBI_00905 [Sesbania bispinosa]
MLNNMKESLMCQEEGANFGSIVDQPETLLRGIPSTINVEVTAPNRLPFVEEPKPPDPQQGREVNSHDKDLVSNHEMQCEDDGVHVNIKDYEVVETPNAP